MGFNFKLSETGLIECERCAYNGNGSGCRIKHPEQPRNKETCALYFTPKSCDICIQRCKAFSDGQVNNCGNFFPTLPYSSHIFTSRIWG